MKDFGLAPHRPTPGHLVSCLPAFCPQIPPIGPVLPTVPTCKYCAVYNLGEDCFHGMEEVIGSIPIRSTNYFNNLGAISGNNRPVPREHLGMESFLEGRFGSSSA